MKSVVLFSGGIDSTTALAWAKARSSEVHALTVDYGQRHRIEVRLAKETARRMGVPQTVLAIDLARFGGSALTDPSAALPRCRKPSDIRSGPPSTYVPFRNGVRGRPSAAWSPVGAPAPERRPSGRSARPWGRRSAGRRPTARRRRPAALRAHGGP